MSAVNWLWMRIANGDFTSGAFPSDVPRVALKGVEQDVGASLAQLLGPGRTRRDSALSDLDSDVNFCRYCASLWINSVSWLRSKGLAIAFQS